MGRPSPIEMRRLSLEWLLLRPLDDVGRGRLGIGPNIVLFHKTSVGVGGGGMAEDVEAVGMTMCSEFAVAL
jgi:hypothetical protein